MNTETLENFISKYTRIEIWYDIIDMEEYKWKALRHFTMHYNKPFETLSSKVERCFKLTYNLLRSNKSFPLSMLCDFAQQDEENTRKALDALYDTTLPLRNRVEQFIIDTEEIFQNLKESGFSNWNEKANVKSDQDTHAISVYLFLRYPNRHYIYQLKIFRTFASKIDYTIQSHDKIDRLLEFYELANEVKTYLLKKASLYSTISPG